jgi:hypothetical protein
LVFSTGREQSAGSTHVRDQDGQPEVYRCTSIVMFGFDRVIRRIDPDYLPTHEVFRVKRSVHKCQGMHQTGVKMYRL